MYSQTDNNGFLCDELLDVEICVPPTEGLLEFGGRMTTFARVLRVDKGAGADFDDGRICAVAAQFMGAPRFSG